MSYSIAMLSVHMSPLDTPGRTRDAGGMNVYIKDLARELCKSKNQIDIFPRRTNEFSPNIVQLTPHVRVIHIQAGPSTPVHKHDLYQYLPAFAQGIDEFRSSEDTPYDILHSHYWLSGVAAMQLTRRWDMPHITMFHTLRRLKPLASPNQKEPPMLLADDAP